tara:strand:+ start:2173 stop:2730 length:558 start_codon:yes stop_codon:yes gene_type:complete
MTRGTRGSSFNNKTSGLERAKDQNPFGAGGRGFSLPANYKQTEADAFEESGAKVSDYYKPSKDATTKFEKGDGKGFLDNVISGGLDYFKKTQEKSDTDKLIDFAKSQQRAAQFGDFAGGAFKEVADGLSYGQLPSQTQQMFIPGQQAQGKSLGQRFAGAAQGLIGGLSTGIPHAGGIGAIGGFFA